MNHSESNAASHNAVRDGVTRALAAVGLWAIALIHLLDVPGKFAETPYMAWMFIGLILASLAVAGALARGSANWAWGAAAALGASAVVGYALSRTTGLPQAMGDIGNWTEPLGLASLFVEGSLLALSTTVLLARGRVGQRAPARRMNPFAIGSRAG
jgi:hypothetical protein